MRDLVREADLVGFHEAICNDNLAAVKRYVEKYDADFINTPEQCGQTALGFAVLCGHQEIICLLIAHGALVNKQDAQGRTALIWAVRNGYRDLVALLLEKGADMNIVDKKGNTVFNFEPIVGDKAGVIQLLHDWPRLQKERAAQRLEAIISPVLQRDLPYRGPLKIKRL